MRVLVVDPGISGAVILFTPDGVQVRRDFSHPEDIAAAIVDLSPSATEGVIELVGARPGQGVTSMFTFGHATGVALGALRYAGFSIFDADKRRLVETHPRVWQKYVSELAGLGVDDEFDSVALARRLLPHTGAWLMRKKDHNTADALLMGLWYIATKPKRGSVRSRDKKRWAGLK